MNDIVRFASDPSPRRQWFVVRPMVNEVCQSLSSRITEQGIKTEIDVPTQLAVVADPTMVRHALLHLVLNSVDVMPHGGELTITGLMSRHGLVLEVADSGPGLSENVQERLFEPHFTTKHDAAGLGLTVVQNIVQSHGGDVSATNCAEGGAAFTIRIPLPARQVAA